MLAGMPATPPRVITISTGTMLRVCAVLLGVGALWLIRDILLYIFIAILLAGLIYPFARWAAAHHIPKGIAVACFYIFLFGIILGAFSLLVPAILEESRHLVKTLGGSWDWFNDLTVYLRTI